MGWELPTGSSELAVGDRLGPYQLEQVLGEGGMGLVFRATREDDGVAVALKLLKIDLAEDETYKRRFIHEARGAAAVTHEHLVPILDAGEIDGRPFLAVAYVEGETLEDRVRREGALPLDDVLGTVDDLGSGLQALHDAGLVHRDIKASNILVATDGSAALTDFGLVKSEAYTVLTSPGQVLGTLDYMAPELIKGHPATPASDIYALGCTIYECVAAKTPFAHKSGFQKGIAHLEEDPPDPGADRADWTPALSAALLSALEKEPSDRPESSAAFARGLRAAAAHS
jgi:serine/threonine protein kinase